MSESVSNELDVVASLLPLRPLSKRATGLAVIDLGCGNGSLLREMLELGLATQAVGVQGDARQHTSNLSKPMNGLSFVHANAAKLPGADAQFDVALMRQTLHHLPVRNMGKALDEAARVLKPGGWLYVSEPVDSGALHGIVKHFKDQSVAHVSAQFALQDALNRPQSPWTALSEQAFTMPVRFVSWADFEKRVFHPALAPRSPDDALAQAVHSAYDRHTQADGSTRFEQPLHARLLLKRA